MTLSVLLSTWTQLASLFYFIRSSKLTIFLEQVILHGEGEFNLDAIKEIKVTQSFLGLEQHVRGCQNKEPFYNCTTRHYNDQFVNQCQCLPFNINMGQVKLQEKS